MSIVVRDVREHELDSVLALNNAAGPAILPLDAAKLRSFFDSAEYFRVAERDGTLAGFLVGFGSRRGARQRQLRAGSARARRRSSTSTASWSPAAAAAAASAARSTPTCRATPNCAIRSWPARCCSSRAPTTPLLFHGSFGFREVGQNVMPENGHRAAMLMKDLCSYAWVRETYGDHLPDAPWLPQPRARQRRRSRTARPGPAREHGDRLRTGRRTQDRPGRHRQPARAHARRRAARRRNARPRAARAQAVRPRRGGPRFRRPQPQTPDVATARALVDGLREAGVLPVALAYGTREIEELSARWACRCSRSSARSTNAPATAPSRSRPRPRAAARKRRTGRAEARARARRHAPAAPRPGMMQAAPVRCGQQVYAENRDLTVLTTVGAGAEVIADGSIHIYGALRGRALAGAQGNEKARIFCREFHAELVAVAGHYKVLEDIPKDLRGKAVQVWLEHGAAPHRGAGLTNNNVHDEENTTWPKSS